MENIIIATFTNERSAKEAQQKLDHFDAEGDITIFDHVMIKKNEKGEIEYLSQEDFDGWRTLTGMAIGGLLGTLGGPVGFVLGLYVGTAIGAVADVSHYQFEQDFMDSLSLDIPNGTVSIIAEVNELSSRFIDELISPFGGAVSRSSFAFEQDSFIRDRIEAVDAKISRVESRLNKAVEAESAEIGKELDALKARRESQVSEINKTGNEMLVDLGKKFESNRLKIQKQIEKFEGRILDASDDISRELDEKMKLHYEKKLEEYKGKIDGVNERLTAVKLARAA